MRGGPVGLERAAGTGSAGNPWADCALRFPVGERSLVAEEYEVNRDATDFLTGAKWAAVACVLALLVPLGFWLDVMLLRFYVWMGWVSN